MLYPLHKTVKISCLPVTEVQNAPEQLAFIVGSELPLHRPAPRERGEEEEGELGLDGS